MLNLASIAHILLTVAAMLAVVFLAGLAGETVGDLVGEGAGQTAAVVVIGVAAGAALIAIAVWARRRFLRARSPRSDR